MALAGFGIYTQDDFSKSVTSKSSNSMIKEWAGFLRHPNF